MIIHAHDSDQPTIATVILRRLWNWLRAADSSWLLALLRRIELPERAHVGPLRRWLPPRHRVLTSGQLGRRSFFVAAASFLGGLAFAIGGHFTEAYVWQTGLVWFAVVGIGWVTYWGGWADQRLRALEGEIGPAFADVVDYQRTYAKSLARVYRRLWPIFWSLLLTAVLLLELLQPLRVVSLQPSVLRPPAVQRLLRHLELLRDQRDLVALPEQPIGLPQLPDDLLRRMPASRTSHRSDCPPRPTWAVRLSMRPDRPQGVTPAELRKKRVSPANPRARRTRSAP